MGFLKIKTPKESVVKSKARHRFEAPFGNGNQHVSCDVTLNLMAPDGQRISALKLADGKLVHADSMLSVAGCTRPKDDPDVMCSYSGFADAQPLINPATKAPYYVQELFARLVAEGRTKALPDAHLHDTSGQPQWPRSPWVQPVWGTKQ